MASLIHLPKSVRSIIVGIVCGLNFFIGFRFSFWWVVLGTTACVYAMLRERTRYDRFMFFIPFSFTFFAPTLWWLHVVGLDAFVLLTLLCCVTVLPVGMVPVANDKFIGPLKFASIWTLCEFIRSSVPWGGFPWSLIGHSQIDGPMINYSRLGGTGALVFTVCLVSGLFVETIAGKRLNLIPVVLALVLIPCLVPVAPSAGIIQVAAVQGSVPQTGLNDDAQRRTVLKNHIDTTYRFKNELRNVDLVVWPESAAGYDPIHDAETRKSIDIMVNQIDKPFLIGGTVWQGSPLAPNNVGILWVPSVGPIKIYSKNHLVPFGEYVPMRSLLTKFIGRFTKVPFDFEAGDGGGVMHFGTGRLGDAICFEVAYDNHIQRLVDEGAQIFTAQSNNSTYTGTHQPSQQFNITRFRTIEHQRATVVATTTGVSGIIDSNGFVKSREEHNHARVLVSAINLVNQKQPVDRLPAYPFEMLSALVLIIFWIRARKKLDKFLNDQTELVGRGGVGSEGD